MATETSPAAPTAADTARMLGSQADAFTVFVAVRNTPSAATYESECLFFERLGLVDSVQAWDRHGTRYASAAMTPLGKAVAAVLAA